MAGQDHAGAMDSSGSIALKRRQARDAVAFREDHLTIAEPAGSYELGLSYRLRYGNGALNLQADDLGFRMKDVAIAQQEGGATLGKLAMIAFEGGSFDLQQRTLAFKEARVADGTINVILDQEGKLDWAKLVRNTPAADAKPGAAEAAPPAAENATAKAPWRVALPKVSIGPLALAVTDHSRVKPLRATIAGAQAGFGIAATVGREIQVTVDNGMLKIDDVRIRSGDDKEPLITLVAAELADGAFDLQQKTARAGLLRLSGGNMQAVREATAASILQARSPLFAMSRHRIPASASSWIAPKSPATRSRWQTAPFNRQWSTIWRTCASPYRKSRCHSRTPARSSSRCGSNGAARCKPKALSICCVRPPICVSRQPMSRWRRSRVCSSATPR